MTLGGKYSQAKKTYRPSDSLVNLVDEFLRHRDKEKELEERIDAGGMTQGQIDREKQALKDRKDNLDKSKVDVLNRHIFPAMANLTILVEKMRENTYIRDIFDDDLRYLFLAKASTPEANNKDDKSIFARFIEASSKMNMMTIMSTELGTDRTTPIPDYRLILCRIMQQSVYETMRDIAPSKFDDPDFAEVAMMVDMKRALAWTKEVSHKAWISEVSHGASTKLRSQMKRRPALF